MSKPIHIVDDQESLKEFLLFIKEEPYSVFETNKLTFEFNDCLVEISPEFYSIVKSEIRSTSKYNNPLIFGKDLTEDVVCIEVKDDNLTLFLTNNRKVTRPNKYWVLSDKLVHPSGKKLQGNQHYRYLYEFSTISQREKFFYRYKNKADFFLIWNEKEAAMIYYGITQFKGLKVKDVSVLSFDIESSGLVKDETAKVFLITNTFRDSKGTVTRKHFRVDEYGDSDIEMIRSWCDWVREINPDIINGHNIFGYDLPYIYFCCTERDGLQYKLQLGRDGSNLSFNKKPSEFRVDGNTSWEYHKCHVFGRHIIDGMFLAVRYDIGRNYPSWGLKQIAEYEGLVKEGRQFYDASKIRTNWYIPEEREKIVQYGIHDSDDSLALYDLHIPSIFYMTQSVPKPLQLMCQSATGSQLNAILIRAYLQEGHSIPKASDGIKVDGGISFGIPGIHKNVLKIDVQSEYPCIIRAFKVYPIKKDPKMYYTQMVDYFTEERFKNKRLYKETGDKYYDDLQAAQKIAINSSYGLTSANGLNFNDFECANFITGMGRQIIKDTLMWATGKPIEHWVIDYEAHKDIIYDNKLQQKVTYSEFVKSK